MRAIAISLLVCLWSTFAYSYTFVFKTGKRIEGTILFEDPSTIRIVDESGVAMSLNRSSLDFAAMDEINAKQKASTDAREARSLDSRGTLVTTAKNLRLSARTGLSVGTKQYQVNQLQSAQREYERLMGECRSAGAKRTGHERLQTHVYVVNGKKVAVTGYWADPDNVRRAKAVCLEALELQEELSRRKKGQQVLKHEGSDSRAASTQSEDTSGTIGAIKK